MMAAGWLRRLNFPACLPMGKPQMKQSRRRRLLLCAPSKGERIIGNVKKYLIIVEETETGYSAFSPDVPGCGSTGKTKDEVERNIQEAIEFHLEGLRLEGYEVPEPTTYSSYIDVAA
jgi:predicted RNase H-like HicB family nuclease